MKWFIALLVLVSAVVAVIFFRKNQSSSTTTMMGNHSEQEQTEALPGASQHNIETSEPVSVTAAENVTEQQYADNTKQPLENPVPSSLVNATECVPEDSTLKRHYLSTLAAKRLALTNPYPSDSTLRRHYQSLLAAKLLETQDHSHPAEAIVIAQAIEPISLTTQLKKPSIPEDATLRRHFLSQVQTEIEASLLPRPTDSTLKRHYDNLLQTRLAEYLAEFA